MISQTAEYALRACLFLAHHREGLNTIPVIAKATEVPAGYLSKVLQTLRRSGLVASTRGKHGGFRLHVEPSAVSLYDIITAVNPVVRVQRCPLTLEKNCPRHGFEFGSSDLGALCPLHEALSTITNQVEQRLRDLTLGDFLEGYDGCFETLGVSLGRAATGG